MIKVTIRYFVVVCLLLAGCRKDSIDNIIPEQSDLLDLKYGSHSAQSVDVYLPENRNSQTKAIIFIHGGFWVGGDKAEMSSMAKQFRDKGYATASVNYRLTGTAENNIHPAQVSDLGKAIEFIQTKAAEWKISANEVALVGASAGGHLALLYTYAYNTSGDVKTVVSLAGPTNLMNMPNASVQQKLVVRWFLGDVAENIPSVYEQASPISHVSSASKPTLLLHGKLDVIVPYEQSLELKTKLDQFGVKNKLVTYENLGHDVKFDEVPGLLTECENWLAENL